MWNETIKDRSLYLRSLADYQLLPNCYIMLMLDGRAFSKYCKRFEKPYSNTFINIMNQVALELCHEVNGCTFAYVQSDEISIVIKQTDDSDLWFNNRINKLCSITASIASSKFTQLIIENLIDNCNDLLTIKKEINNLKLVSFDCKAWNIPTIDDVYAWFLYRQRDCIRNSKSMLAQHYLSHKTLEHINCDEQIELVKEKFSIDWNEYSDDKKFGRFLWKEPIQIPTTNNKNGDNFIIRNKWVLHSAFPLTIENKEDIIKIINNDN